MSQIFKTSSGMITLLRAPDNFQVQRTYEFHMEMTCEGCANAAKKVLGKQGDKVSEVVTDVGTKTVKVTSSMSSDEVLEVLKKTGIEVSFKG